MAYESIHLDEEIHIERIFTIHYFEYMSDFSFPGERHNFWEFQCVDKGDVHVRTDNGTFLLKQGQVIFHKPNEFHNLNATGKSAPNIVVVSFECTSPCMRFFENKILHISDTERNLMGLIITEARRCIRTPLDDPYTEKMEKRPDALPGSQQLIRIYLEQLLILMLRRNTLPRIAPPHVSPETIAGTKHDILYDQIILYMEEHIRENVTISKICRDNLVSRSQLQKMFHRVNGCGIIDFFLQMKITFAKQLIRENEMDFSQIADFLGYSSIHYFSRQFKVKTGMAPTEYVSSIKAKSEHHLMSPSE